MQNPTSKLGRFFRPLSKHFILQTRRLRLMRVRDVPRPGHLERAWWSHCADTAPQENGCGSAHFLYCIYEEKTTTRVYSTMGPREPSGRDKAGDM